MIVTIDKFDRDDFESFQRVHFEIEELIMYAILKKFKKCLCHLFDDYL